MFEVDWDKITDFCKEVLTTYGPRLLLAILILWIGFKVIRSVQRGVERMCRKSSMAVELSIFLSRLVGWLLKFLLIVTIIDLIGISTTSFIALLGAAGLAVGLALQGTLANFAGGVLIMLFKPFKIGDIVESQGVIGKVKEIQVFNTIILTLGNKTAIMPNGNVMNNHIINYSEEGVIRVDTSIGISYNADIKKAKEIIMKTLLSDENVAKDPLPIVAVTELGDNSVNLVVRPWCEPRLYWDVHFKSLENCKIALDEAGISIPFPQRDVHIYNHETN